MEKGGAIQRINLYFRLELWFCPHSCRQLKGIRCKSEAVPATVSRPNIRIASASTTVQQDGKEDALGKPGDLPKFEQLSNFRDKGLGNTGSLTASISF